MIIAVDIGNTNIKIGVFEDNKLIHSFKMSSDIHRTSDEYLALLTQLLHYYHVDTSKIDGAIISSVIPQLDYTFNNVLKYAFGIQPINIGVGVKTGLDVKYDNPRELGSDRIISCVGALLNYQPPFLLVDCGTATTFNVVNQHRQFVGGAITLGIKSTAESLATSTSKLQRVDLDQPSKLIATSTTEAIQSGILYGTLGTIKYMIQAVAEQLGVDNLTVIATGGLSQLIYNIEPVFSHIDRQLSLTGLCHIYNLNTKCKK